MLGTALPKMPTTCDPIKIQCDQRTLVLLKKRDPALLEQIFHDTNPYLLKMLSQRSVSRETAADLIQASWEVFFKSLDRFEGRSQIKVFLGGILLNKLREHHRGQNRLVSEEDPENIMSNAFTPDGWWKTGPADPFQSFESKQVIGFIQDCMEGLTEHQKSAFLLKEIEGEGTEGICKILGVSVTHLGVLIFRAKDKLMKCLSGKMSSELN